MTAPRARYHNGSLQWRGLGEEWKPQPRWLVAATIREFSTVEPGEDRLPGWADTRRQFVADLTGALEAYDNDTMKEAA